MYNLRDYLIIKFVKKTTKYFVITSTELYHFIGKFVIKNLQLVKTE